MNRALIVDGVATGRDVIGEALVEAGFGVLFAADDDEALSLLERERPDLIVTDHHKPNVDAIELVRLVRAVSDVPVVVMTAFGSVSDCEMAMRSGADRFLQLRSDLDRIGRVARELVEAPRAGPERGRVELTAQGARALRERELRTSLQALVIECRGNIAEIARRMNRDRSTVRYHLRRMGLLG